MSIFSYFFFSFPIISFHGVFQIFRLFLRCVTFFFWFSNYSAEAAKLTASTRQLVWHTYIILAKQNKRKCQNLIPSLDWITEKWWCVARRRNLMRIFVPIQWPGAYRLNLPAIFDWFYWVTQSHLRLARRMEWNSSNVNDIAPSGESTNTSIWRRWGNECSSPKTRKTKWQKCLVQIRFMSWNDDGCSIKGIFFQNEIMHFEERSIEDW